MVDEKPGAEFGIVMYHKVIDVPNHGQRLMVAFQLQGPGGVPLSHMLEVPGEAVPVIIASLQQMVEQYPALTTDLCVVGPSKQLTPEELQANKPSGLVDAGGSPLKIVKH